MNPMEQLAHRIGRHAAPGSFNAHLAELGPGSVDSDLACIGTGGEYYGFRAGDGRFLDIRCDEDTADIEILGTNIDAPPAQLLEIARGCILRFYGGDE